ncbi:hypothetical protein EOPP23_11885 [Endozoicomonas sp. OPT23]|nr:hypothetical protein [Endozoicomonas sp. OPT23]
MKKRVLLVLMGALGLVSTAQANTSYAFSCKHFKEERKVEVVYLQRESSLPCEVRYTKDEVSETLWNANYTKGYCEDKAAEFVEKQEDWGWSCQRVEKNTTAG